MNGSELVGIDSCQTNLVQILTDFAEDWQSKMWIHFHLLLLCKYLDLGTLTLFSSWVPLHLRRRIRCNEIIMFAIFLANCWHLRLGFLKDTHNNTGGNALMNYC